jgi:hypothetical protein
LALTPRGVAGTHRERCCSFREIASMTHQWWLAPLVVAAATFAAGPVAAADCKSDLVASQQGLKASGAGVSEVSVGPDAGKCPAYRKHLAAMVKFREVLSRCDTGAQRAEHVAQLNASIDDFRKKAPTGCK